MGDCILYTKIMDYQFGWPVLQVANLVGELLVGCFASNDGLDPVHSICTVTNDDQQHKAYKQSGSLFTLS